MSIERITLAKTAKETMQATELERHDDVPVEARNTGDEYVVKRVYHKDEKDGTKYLVR